MNSISNSNWEAAFLHSILFSDHKILGTQSHFREPFWEQHLLKLISVLVAQPMVQNWVSASWEGRFSVSHGCMFCGIHRIWAQMHSRCWIACRDGFRSMCATFTLPMSEDCGLRNWEWVSLRALQDAQAWAWNNAVPKTLDINEWMTQECRSKQGKLLFGMLP